MPVVFAYPEVDDAPPDLLEACAPADLIADWLLTLFPDDNGPAWDTAGAYRAPVVTCYARLRQVTGFYRGDAYAEYRARREKDGGKFDRKTRARRRVLGGARGGGVSGRPRTRTCFGRAVSRGSASAVGGPRRLARADQGAGDVARRVRCRCLCCSSSAGVSSCRIIVGS